MKNKIMVITLLTSAIVVTGCDSEEEETGAYVHPRPTATFKEPSFSSRQGEYSAFNGLEDDNEDSGGGATSLFLLPLLVFIYVIRRRK